MRTRIQSIQYLTAIVLSTLVMAQSAGWRGEKPPWNCGILASESSGTTTIMGTLETKISLGNGAKHGLVSSEFYFASTLTEAQINDLGDIGGKPRAEGERTLISNLYLCLGHEGQRALHNQHPHLDMETIRYPRFLDTCVALFQKEQNQTYEMYQMLSRKQKEGESLELLYAELSGMAARCNLGTQERKMVRDIFIFNMRNRDAQNELCRETKTPEEALRIAMAYERGDKYAKTYKGVASGST